MTRSESGFSLIDIMIAMAITSVTLISILSLINTATSAQKAAEDAANISMLMDEVKANLSDNGRCTLNLQGISLSMSDAAGARPANGEIRYYDHNGTPGPVILAMNAVDAKLKVTDMRVVPLAQTDIDRFVGKFTVTLQSNALLGQNPVLRHFLLNIDTVAGKITSCSTADPTLVSSVKEIVCDDSGTGPFWINPTTGKCERRQIQWFPGDENSASCPSGWSVPVVADVSIFRICRAQPPPGYVYTLPGPCNGRKMNDPALVNQHCPKPAIMTRGSAPNSCQSHFAPGVNPAGFVSMVQCQID